MSRELRYRGLPARARLKYSEDAPSNEQEKRETEHEEYFKVVPPKAPLVNPLSKRRGIPKYARDIKRRKLFLLSTLLDDLLPDPSQYQSQLLNMIVDAGKITRRGFFGVLNFVYELPTSGFVLLVIALFLFSFAQFSTQYVCHYGPGVVSKLLFPFCI